MTEVWIVQRECGDYYCEGHHVAAVATSEAEAERLRDEILALRTRHTYEGRDAQTLPVYSEYAIEVVGPFPVGVIDVPHNDHVHHPAPTPFESMLLRSYKANFVAPLVTRAINNFPKTETT